MAQVILINGYGGVGKDTFIDFVRKYYTKGEVDSISTVDKVKIAAEYLGWDGKKDEKGRSFLSKLKFLACEYDSDFSRKYIEDCLSTMGENDVLFVHVREPEEIHYLKTVFNGVTILVQNNRIPQPHNRADLNVFNYAYDFIIINESSLEELKITARTFASTVLIDAEKWRNENV